MAMGPANQKPITYKQVGRPLAELVGQFEALARIAPELGYYAVIDSLRRTRTFIDRETREIINVKAGAISKRVKLIPPTRGRPLGSLVYSEKAPIPITAFKSVQVTGSVTPTGRERRTYGVRVKIRNDEPPTYFRAAFLKPLGQLHGGRVMDPIDMANLGGPAGMALAYIRAKKPDGTRVKRNPVWVLFGPSPLGLLQSRPGFFDAVEAFAYDALEQGVDRRLERILERRGIRL